MGKCRVPFIAGGGKMNIVNSEIIQGYSLYETLEPGTFVTKAGSTTVSLTPEYQDGAKAYMITSSLGIYFWYDVEYSSSSSSPDHYTCYAKAFKVNKEEIQWGTTVTYVADGLEYSTLLDAISISENRLLVARVYGTSTSYGDMSLYANCKLVVQYFTVNNDLSITLGTELILKTGYSYSHWASFQKAPNGNIYMAFEKSGSYRSSYSTSYSYCLYICLLNLGSNAPTLTTTLKVIDATNYYPFNPVGFSVLSNTTALLHYDYTHSNYGERSYCLPITFSGNSITILLII